MGFLNDAKAATAEQAAKKAYDEGRHVLTFKIIEANASHRSTGLMSGVGEQIEAIERQGWTLTNMAAAEGKALTGDRTALVCLFRRR
ncbi:hypothetical protein [Streptomyces scabiei]|uniref:hypothetical protein n=1 Tax=Streptomyces scabiei TaxID=1930 RepID=UPI0004E7836F|nr:hypothetical protein [Streptomyces scabiei]KFG08113.1 hypothetical protein IQ61_15345 [Streptomyces scabiei]MDX3681381.1 hypothetical protein [Streptomyces scabiei]